VKYVLRYPSGLWASSISVMAASSSVGGGQDALGEIALVEDEALVEGTVVDKNLPSFASILRIPK
jgi:hypothetical protein